MKKLFSHLQRPVSNRRGVAMITAIAALTIMTYLAMEVMYDTQVEYVIHSQNLNRLKAYYAARSGVEISLLRIKLYQTLVTKLGKNLPTDGMVDQIWQFPFMWPLEAPPGIDAVEADQIRAAVKESKMDATFSTKISDEGAKIDINDLTSPSKTLREITKNQILNIFQNKMKNDEKFARRHGGFRFEELVNNIADWMSNKNSSSNGSGDKRTPYRQQSVEDFPPNRGFRTLQELRLVAGMTDEFYQMLEPNITIYGLKGLNPNTASNEVLQALDPSITPEIVSEVRKRIETPNLGGPFKDGKDFWDFLESKGARLTIKREDIPIVTSGLFSFRISSIGDFGGAQREIEVVVLDLDQAATRLNDLVKADKKKESGDTSAEKPDGTKTQDPLTGTGDPASGPGSTSNSNPLPKGPPRIVYWSEK